jgi:outer membrane protein assembly factor BamB
MKIVVVVSFLLASACLPPHTNSFQSTVPFTRVERIGDPNARSFFVFSTSMRDYAIRHDGHGEGSSATVMRKNFDLRMDGASRLERVYFSEFEGDLLLAYEVSTSNGDWSYVSRFNQKTMKLLWVRPMSVERLGPGVVETTGAYFGSANALFKLDVKSGAVLWQQAQVAREFDLPIVKSESVIFRELREVGRIVEVEKSTGRLVVN